MNRCKVCKKYLWPWQATTTDVQQYISPNMWEFDRHFGCSYWVKERRRMFGKDSI